MTTMIETLRDIREITGCGLVEAIAAYKAGVGADLGIGTRAHRLARELGARNARLHCENQQLIDENRALRDEIAARDAGYASVAARDTSPGTITESGVWDYDDGGPLFVAVDRCPADVVEGYAADVDGKRVICARADDDPPLAVGEECLVHQTPEGPWAGPVDASQ